VQADSQNINEEQKLAEMKEFGQDIGVDIVNRRIKEILRQPCQPDGPERNGKEANSKNFA
jgi:hypothetical protein